MFSTSYKKSIINMKKLIVCLFAAISLICLVNVNNAQLIKIHFITSQPSTAVEPLSKKDRTFFMALAKQESNNDPKKINKFGYIGKYQFGEEALEYLGYYRQDGTKKNDWIGDWTGKNGIYSKKDFLNNAAVQDHAVKELAMLNWRIARNNKLHHFIGETIHGVTITKAGIIAGMHLKGEKGVINFINFQQNSYDAMGTGVKDYMHKFAVYNI